MKTIYALIFTILFSFSMLQAQTKALAVGTDSSAGVNEKLTKAYGSLVSVELRIDKLKGFVEVTVNEPKSLYENIQTAEDKMKIRNGLDSMENIKLSRTFQDVISNASGRMNLESHEILYTDQEIIHYFIFSL